MPTETTIQSGAPCKPSLAASGLPSEPTVPPNWSNVVAQARAAARVEDSSSELALAHSLFAAYKGGHEVVCLAEALTLFRRLHKSSSTNDIGQVTLDYGEALYAEYRRSGQIEPINDLLAIHEQSPPCPDSLQARLDLQRANAFLARGTFTSNQKDIAEAKKLMDACAPPHSAESFDFEAAVVSAAYHSIVWFMTGQNDREAFRHLSHGLLMHLKSQHPLQRRADVLSTCLRIIPSSLFFNESVDLDVKEATELAEETVLTIDSRREPLPDRALIMHDLARFYYFLANSDPANMQKSGQLIEQALYAAGDNNIDRSGAFLARGDWLWKSRAVFGAGNSSMFEDAAVQYRKALNHCPRWHTRRTQCLVGLSCNLVDQFNQAGACAGLKEIITLSEHHPDVLQSSPLFVLNVTEAFMLRTKAGRLRPPAKQALLQRAASTLKVALANIPESHTYRCALLVQLNLVYVLLDRFGYPIGEGEHLSVARRSASTKASAAHHWLSLFYLATALLGFASRRRDLEMLQESFLLVERLATDTTTSRWNLDLAALHASCHMVRFGILGETADLKTAERMFESSDPAQHSDFSGWMALRLERFTTWARLARYAAQPMSEMCAYRRAIDLLPRLAYIGEDSGTQVEAVQLAQGIACRAAALALTLDDAPRALELLEESRSVVWSQSLHLRVSPTAIPPQHMIAFQQSIESLKSASGPAERHGHAAQLEATIADIRQVEGYDRFLLPRVYGELRSCASHGVVVVLIPSETFTDVVTIRDPTSTPTHLRLAALKLSRLQDLTAKFRRANNRHRDAESMRKVKKVGIADRRLSVTNTKEGPTDVLHQLWTSLVHPIITSLEMKASSKDATAPRPRLWWCPTGPLAELPLHAAGIYDGPSQDCVSNYAVSSYTPTLSALINAQSARNNPSPSTTPSADVLVVSSPEVLGLPPLPNALAEAALIRDAVPAPGPIALSNELASIEHVLARLPNVGVLHLACHGHQSQDDPLNSGFSLHDGRLTLKQLMHLDLPRAELAYLSACETASTDEFQPDEALNLATTMLFVGFKSVIATMWSMDDMDGPFIAKHVYSAIFREGRLDLGAVPYALDAAVRELREAGAHPSRWATYVHIGA